MDGLGWDGSPDLTNISSSWRRNQQHGIEGNFEEDIQNGNQFTPSMDSINVVSNLNLLQHQEAILSPAELRSVNGLMADFGMPLSATNSYTDTSVEDDNGISVLFSDCKNLWNFGSMISTTAVSSGDSATNSSKNKDESVSQCSSESNPNPTKSSNGLSQPIPGGTSYCYPHLLESDHSVTEGGFQLISDDVEPKLKKPRSEKRPISSSNINFQQPSLSSVASVVDEEPDSEAIAQMKEMIYRAAAFRPVNLGAEVVERPRRKNVRISSDPQTVAARQRRERIGEKIRVLQRLVPGGSKMDTASMLDEAANYLKFLRSQVKALETLGPKLDFMNCPTLNHPFASVPFNHSFPMQTHFPLQNPNYQIHLPES